VLPLEILVIDYAELASDLEGESGRPTEFLGPEGDPTCVNFISPSAPYSPPAPGRCANRCTSRSVGRWRYYARHPAL
jgi:hypothetical protein